MRRGHEPSFARIVTRFLPRLRRQARRRLPADIGRVVDPDEIALSALYSVWQSVQEDRGSTARMKDRHDLLRLLAKIIAQKVGRAWRFNTQQKRDIRRTVGDADVAVAPEDSPPLHSVPGRERLPEQEAAFRETLARFLAGLQPKQRAVARLRLQGYEINEIARALDCSVRTVERRLSTIRSALQDRSETDKGRNFTF